MFTDYLKINLRHGWGGQKKNYTQLVFAKLTVNMTTKYLVVVTKLFGMVNACLCVDMK